MKKLLLLLCLALLLVIMICSLANTSNKNGVSFAVTTAKVCSSALSDQIVNNTIEDDGNIKYGLAEAEIASLLRSRLSPEHGYDQGLLGLIFVNQEYIANEELNIGPYASPMVAVLVQERSAGLCFKRSPVVSQAVVVTIEREIELVDLDTNLSVLDGFVRLTELDENRP